MSNIHDEIMSKIDLSEWIAFQDWPLAWIDKTKTYTIHLLKWGIRISKIHDTYHEIYPIIAASDRQFIEIKFVNFTDLTALKLAIKEHIRLYFSSQENQV